MDDALMLDALASSMADNMMVDTVLDRAMDPSELIIKSVEEIHGAVNPSQPQLIIKSVEEILREGRANCPQGQEVYK